MRGVMERGRLARPNVPWMDEAWMAHELRAYEGRGFRRLWWGGLALTLLGFWLTVGLLLL